MAQDERDDGRETQWQGNGSFGEGWGNQTSAPEAPPADGAGTSFGQDAAAGDLVRGSAGFAGRFGGDGPDFAIRNAQWAEAVARVRPHMEVVGSDGGHVGTVDKVRGEHIVLTRSGDEAGGVHHAIPCGWIDGVDDKVVLNLTAEEATSRWREEGRSRALFERENSGSDGPRMLNRSFPGTYSKDK
jgi:hypothetical protein